MLTTTKLNRKWEESKGIRRKCTRWNYRIRSPCSSPRFYHTWKLANPAQLEKLKIQDSEEHLAARKHQSFRFDPYQISQRSPEKYNTIQTQMNKLIDSYGVRDPWEWYLPSSSEGCKTLTWIPLGLLWIKNHKIG